MRKIKRIHFIGIGGTGMCGIAQVLLNEGYQISGSDLNENATLDHLRQQGAIITIGHHADNVQDVDAVVVSTAVKDSNPEVIAAKQREIPLIPRAQMLAELMRFRYGIAVAGTHGKTTTTSLVASILAEADLDPTYVIGGRLNSSGSNAKLGTGRYLVAEADESDASFLFLQPMISIVTNIDADHMETYQGDMNRLYQTFTEFLHHLPFYGLAILCVDDPGVRKILPNVSRPKMTYGFSDDADVWAMDIQHHGLQTYFTVKRHAKDDIKVCINLPGRHNVLNALSAMIVAFELGISEAVIAAALQKFQGVGRRCQVLGHFIAGEERVTVIDDYGHHPRELAATQQAIKAAYPGQRVITVFQPHRYSRTRDLYEDFVHTLAGFDKVVILDVYAAGEDPIAGADSRSLCGSIRQLGKVDPIFVDDPKKLSEILQNIIQKNDVILMQGAGSVSSLAHQLVKG